MSTDTKTMTGVLKRLCVPTLRNLGFKGSFPHFFRETGTFVSLVTVQFASAGGSFCVNLGYADPRRKNFFVAPKGGPEKLRVSQTRNQFRLGATAGGDHWFVFGNASASAYRGSVEPSEDLAARFNALLTSEAENWWARMRADPKG